MKKLTIPTGGNYKLGYLTLISSIANITTREVELIYQFMLHDNQYIKDSDVKKSVAADMHINIKTLHVILKNLENKGLLIKESRGVYKYNTILHPEKEVIITFK